MIPAGLPSTIHALRTLILRKEISVPEAIRLQHAAVGTPDRYHCVTHRFPLSTRFPDAACPLSGVGVAHKDIFHMSGRAPDCGMGIPDRRSTRAATVVRRGQNKGATVLAALTMAEHASGVTGENPNLPLPINPIDPKAAVGGSSSGSAVAVAAGLCYGSLGTDTAGSVRIPAATCGVIGFKPSRGALSCAYVAPLSPSLDTVGILARDPIDAAILFRNSLSDRVGRAVFGDQDPAIAITAAAAIAKRGRVAVCMEHVNPKVAMRPDVRLALEHFVSLTSDGSAEIRLPHLARMIRNAELILNIEASGTHLAALASSRYPIGKSARMLALTGAAIPGAWYVEALGDRDEIAASFVQIAFANAEFIVTPALPQGVPDWAAVHTESREFDARSLLELFSWMSFVNYLGLPSVVLPIGMDAFSRPICAQVLAKPGCDFRLLVFAAYARGVLG